MICGLIFLVNPNPDFKMYDAKTKAREISAKLIPHLTSVHNVELIAVALQEARMIGRIEACNNVASIINPTSSKEPIADQ